MAFQRRVIDRGAAIRYVLVLSLAFNATAQLVATPAHAQVTTHDTQTADALFEEGRKLMAQGRVRDACTKFKDSLEKAPGVGTQLNLGDCYERLGLTASAWSTFKDAEAEAHRTGKSDRERTARERAKQLEAKLGKIVLVFAEKLDKTGEVKRDGLVLDDAVISGPIPTDPGLHKIEVTAKGKKPLVLTVEVAQGPVQQKVDVPRLEPDGTAIVTTAEPGGEKATPRYSASMVGAPSGSPLRTVGLVTAGVGIVAIGVGAYFGVRTYSLWKDVLDRCDPTACDAQGKQSGDDARTAGTISTVGFVAGGLLTAGGIVMFIVAPKSSSPSVEAKSRVYPMLSAGQLGAGWEAKF